jgi:hypothetical protein
VTSRFLSDTGLIFALLNAVGAAGATIVNGLAFHRTGFRGPRMAYAITATFAAFYSGAYIVLAFVDVVPADWSSLMRGVSVLTWPLIWSAHASAKVWSGGPRRWADAVIEDFERKLDGDG